MSSGDVPVQTSPVLEVSITSLFCTVKACLFLYYCVDMIWIQLDEAKFCLDHAVMKPLMSVP